MNYQAGKRLAGSGLMGAALVMGSFATMNAWAEACYLTFDNGQKSCYLWTYTETTCLATINTIIDVNGVFLIVTVTRWEQSHTVCVIDPLLATDVDLTATLNGTGVDLTLTTSAEPDTAALSILRGEKLDNGGTAIKDVCNFASGGSPYTCTDNVVGDTYRALEIEYDGEIIVYDEVTPK